MAGVTDRPSGAEHPDAVPPEGDFASRNIVPVDRHLFDRTTDVAQGSKKFQVEGEATAFEPSMDSGISRGRDEFQPALTVVDLGIEQNSDQGGKKTTGIMAKGFSFNLSAEHTDAGAEKCPWVSRGGQEGSQSADFLGRNGAIRIHKGKIIESGIFIPSDQDRAAFAEVVGEEERFEKVGEFLLERSDLATGFRLFLRTGTVIHDLNPG